MTKRIFALLLALVLVVGLLPVGASAAAPASGGAGTAADPYLITSAQDLMDFRDLVNASTNKSTSVFCAKLTNDIDLSTAGKWTPIGAYSSYSSYVAYGGTFDGNGHTIKGLSIETTAAYQALIGYAKGCTVLDLTVEGTVTVTGTSSPYAAGIIGNGSDVTLERCTNRVNVTTTQKGYAGGVASYLSKPSSGNRLIGCRNEGKISGCGDYVGGIVASATGATIEGCLNTGEIVDNGKPGSYNYGVGGVAGSVSSTTLERCGNTGAVTSTLKRTGGVVGSLSGTMTACFNSGNITGIYALGGVVGSVASKDSEITDCYNLGTVTGQAPKATFSDSGAKGIGGVVGDPSSASVTNVTVENCYNAGAVTNQNTDATDITIGGVIGCSVGKNYKGEPTAELITAKNCYYLAAEGLNGDGYNGAAAGVTAKTDDELKASGMAALLGGSYADQAGNYPILGWQDPNAKYPVTFVLSPADAALTVRSGEETVQPRESNRYSLGNGTYTYEVSAPECETVTGSFTVAYSGTTISVTLVEKRYNVVFTLTPADATLVVDGQTPLADGRTFRLTKSGNPYTYHVSAFGYQAVDGSFSVSGAGDDQNVTLTALPTWKVRFGAITAADGETIAPVIRLTSTDWPQQSLEAGQDGSYELPDGNYTYTISCQGYKTVRGSFTVAGVDLNLPGVELEVQTAWDGITLTEPQKDEDGYYRIGTPDELMWLNKNAKMTDNVRLTADIRINEDLSTEDSNLFGWKPIGSSSARYTGTFDGGGHTISGLYIFASSNTDASKYVGLIGYGGTDSKIQNLTISDSLIHAESTGNYGKYVGAFAGDIFDLENCHTTDTVQVYGMQYVGGLAGYLDGTASRCSNRASVTAKTTYVGGLFGDVYSQSSTAVVQSYNAGVVTGTNLVGGLAGTLYNGGTMADVYNTGSVTATGGLAGGFVGELRYGSLKNAYQAGTVSGTTVGSVAGRLDFSRGQKNLDNLYVRNDGYNDIGNLNNCTAPDGKAQEKTEEELKALASSLGDSFAEDATGLNSGYPILVWQKSGSDEPEDPDAPASDPGQWDGKTKTQPSQTGGVYQIGSAAELKWFADAVKSDAAIGGVLTANIDLNNRNWTPVAGFAGSLDGKGFEIQNFYCKNLLGAAALFLDSSGEIRDLTLSGKVIGSDNTAMLVSVNKGTITGCAVKGTVAGGNYTAGLAAVNTGTITGSTNEAGVSGAQYVGGISGQNKGTKDGAARIESCVNLGMIRASGFMAGGITGDNDGYGESFDHAAVKNCASSGHVISTAAVMQAYVGGIIGRNNGVGQNLYNEGNVEAVGGCVGGTVGRTLSKATSDNTYNTADVTGGDYEDDGYPTDDAVSTETELAQAKRTMGQVLDRLPQRETISGSLTMEGQAAVEATVRANYTGEETGLVYVWYLSYGEDDPAVLAISEDPEYVIPLSMAGRKLYVKALCAGRSGVLQAETGRIQGLTGVLKIQGPAVIGRTLTAEFTASDPVEGLQYQWYRDKALISGANQASYTVTQEDLGKKLTLRVTSNQIPGSVEVTTAAVMTQETAGMWDLSQCQEPALVAGIYQITTEQELHWFASEINGGNTGISGKLVNDIALTSENWYPIGRGDHGFAGIFDGNGKTVSGLKLVSDQSETGFFGLIAGGGKVQSLTVSGTVTATGDVSQTGGIAGAMEDEETAASITDCHFSGSVTGNLQVGGIVGCVGLHNKVEKCSNTARVTGKQQVGGIAGANSYGNLYYCFNTGAVGGEDAKYVGGIVGENQNYAELVGCYNRGAVTGADYVGGVAGQIYVASMALGCYNTAEVSLTMHSGGAVGSFGGDEYITIKTGSFFQGPLSEGYQPNGAKARTAEQMTGGSFAKELNQDAYVQCYQEDTAKINDGYPVLTWQRATVAQTEERIAAIGSVSVDSESRIAAARAAYDSLTEAERALVSNYSVLTDAETLLAHLKDCQKGEHVCKSWTIIAQSGCETEGSMTADCIYCGEEQTQILPALGHDWDEGVETKKPTCTEEGEMTYTCQREGCGATRTEAIAKIPHTYESVVTKPTCEGIGYTTYTCSVCGDSYVDDIVKALGHDYEEVVTAPTCDKMGYTTHTCKTCGLAYVDTFTDALEHDFVKTVTKEPTCTEEGEMTFTCAHEGCTETYTQPIPKTDHDLEETKVEATCTEYGYTTYSCKNCDYSYVGGIVQPKGHDWDEGTITKMPTAYEEGEITFTCAVCGETKVEKVAKLGSCDGGKNCPSAKFTDVSASQWYHEAVDYAVVNGLFAGTSDTTFSPNESMTRGMLVTVLWRLAGKPEAKTAASFQDVDAQQYYAEAVAWAAENGIVAGTSDTTFSPNAKVTREQMAAILYRYAKLNGVDVSKTADLKDFPDADKVASYAKDAMAWAVESGIISGTLKGGKTYLDPTGSATRAQVASILMRYAKNFG